MSIVKITKENFAAEVEQAGQPVLLDFWAPWCGYCQMLAPVLEKLAAEWAAEGRAVKIGKVNTDEQPELAEAYAVDALPTLLVFKNGEPVKRAMGFKPKEAVAALLD